MQFFNVGKHNHVRLEGADWNDGLDMAKENGESVAFSAMYAGNLSRLAELLVESGRKRVTLAKELKILLARFDYEDIKAKRRILNHYFAKSNLCVSGERVSLDTDALAANLQEKAKWILRHIRKHEWLREGFFNGYYDNKFRRVEGKRGGVLRMSLAAQVFPIMSGVAAGPQVSRVIKNVGKYLFDKNIAGLHLNTDFKQEQPDLGRAFSFVYGEKENGAIFNHMAVMYAYSLYKRGFAKEGWEVLNSIYKMSLNTQASRIYPCLPEYFNLEGRGMYSYLTGSASWFVLTMLTQAFGVKGHKGDLRIAPALTKAQFAKSSKLSICRNFAGRRLCVTFSNPQKLEWGKYRITKASLDSRGLPITDKLSLTIPRSLLLKLSATKIHSINIILGL